MTWLTKKNPQTNPKSKDTEKQIFHFNDSLYVNSPLRHAIRQDNAQLNGHVKRCWGVDMILLWATPLLALVSGSCLRWITYNYRLLLQWPTQELSHILHKLHSKDNFLNLGVKFAKRWQTSSSASAWNPGCDPEDIGRKSPHFTSHIIYATCFLLSERIPLPHTARQQIKSIKQSPNQSMSWCFDNGTPPSAQSLIPGAGDPLGGRH